MATKAQIAKLQADLKKAEANLKKAAASNKKLGAAQAAPKPIPNFTPSVTMPAPVRQPGEPGFVGPVAPTPITRAANDYLNLGPLGGLGAGVVAGVTGAPTPAATGAGAGGAGGAGTGGSTTSGSEKYAGLVALLTSYGIDKIANMVDKVIADFPEADGDEILNLLRYDARYNAPYLERFSGNRTRLNNKMPLLAEDEYLKQEMGYAKMFNSYGLKSFSNTNQYAKLIGADVSVDEAAARVSLAYDRVLKADKSTLDSFRKFFPMLGNQDLVAAMLDPDEQLPALERKVQSAEIGGAALRQGLSSELVDTTVKSAMYSNVQAGTIGASTIETAGVSPATAGAKYQKIAGELPTMEKLSSIYGSTLEQYGQREAEQAEILGLASARRKQERLIERERAAFQGSSGTARGSQGRPTQGQF